MTGERWAAAQDYAPGCGSVAIYGLKSRAEAVAWLHRQFMWRDVWYLSPSWRVWRTDGAPDNSGGSA